MMSCLITRAPIPRSIESVTSIAADREVDPGLVGVERAGVDAIWRAIETLYRDGLHPAIQLCVRRRGQVLIDRAIGYAHGAGPHDPPDGVKIPVTPETPFNTFSASKAVTAMVIHLLDQQHLLHLDDPVCEYIPEFAAHGKRWVTIRHVLTHRAGIPNVPPEAMRLELLEEPNEILRVGPVTASRITRSAAASCWARSSAGSPATTFAPCSPARSSSRSVSAG
jgi:CubicO group peptidase (beta-lactamase class C family)